TYAGCITQTSIFILFAGLENFLLAVMAFDRDGSICHPLHYMVIMNSRLCVLLVLLSWITSVLNSLSNSLMALRLSFCTHVEIPHFFCELNQLIHLACSNTLINDIVLYFGGPFIGILYSYYKIGSSICAISSAQGKHKAFSTCASHLLVVFLFYCTILGVYFSAGPAHNSQSSATASVMYTVV
ncbi:olfactory receptor 7A10-like, partial [Tupaia chinensis]|uniref:olfactory receptor 7A10-like n=1 Tax=Tupaia chinensis TaxID=246437 RepID=UPI000FFBE361